MSMTAWVEPAYGGTIADFTALNTFTAEASLLQPTGNQPFIRAHFFSGPGARGRRMRFRAWGVVSSTGTPTFQFAGRLSATVGTATVDGTLVGQSAAITTGNGITNQIWVYELLLTCRVPGQGGTNATINCAGTVRCPGFAAPYEYILVPTTGTPQTWTQTIRNDVDLFFNLTATCGTSHASNAITCKELEQLAI